MKMPEKEGRRTTTPRRRDIASESCHTSVRSLAKRAPEHAAGLKRPMLLRARVRAYSIPLVFCNFFV